MWSWYQYLTIWRNFQLSQNICTLFITVVLLLSVVLYLRNKTCFPCLHSLVKTEANVWENLRADQWKPKMQSRLFTCSRNLTNFAKVFNRLWRHTQHVLFLLYKIIIFSVNNEKDSMQSSYCKFSQLGGSQTTFIFMLPSAMKTHLLTNLNPCTIQIIL